MLNLVRKAAKSPKKISKKNFAPTRLSVRFIECS